MIIPNVSPNKLYIQGTYNNRYILVAFSQGYINEPLEFYMSVKLEEELSQHQVKSAVMTSDHNFIINVGTYMNASTSFSYIQIIDLEGRQVTNWQLSNGPKFSNLYLEDKIQDLIIFAGFDIFTSPYQSIDVMGIANINGSSPDFYTLLCQATSIYGKSKLVAYQIFFEQRQYFVKQLVEMSSTQNIYTDMKVLGLSRIYYVGYGSDIGQNSPNLHVNSMSKFGIVSKYVNNDKDEISLIFREYTLPITTSGDLAVNYITFETLAITKVCLSEACISESFYLYQIEQPINIYPIKNSTYLSQLKTQIIQNISEAVIISQKQFYSNLSRTEDNVFSVTVYFDCLNVNMRNQQITFEDKFSNYKTSIEILDIYQSIRINFTYPVQQSGQNFSFSYDFYYRDKNYDDNLSD
eukprot:403347956